LPERYQNASLLLNQRKVEGKVGWSSPSNIALIKYWGKFKGQLPKNASLSFTLNDCNTHTEIHYKSAFDKPKKAFFFNGEKNDKFSQRLWTLLESFKSIYPFLQQLDLSINSRNSFPHSAGIASSASAMSALALCLVEMEQKLFNHPLSNEAFFQKASYLARLGSGSAARSAFGGYSIWGETAEVEDSSDFYAINLKEEIHPRLSKLYDAILIVNADEKSVSSSAGHLLMDSHPFADSRIDQARKNMKRLLSALKNGDGNTFIEIVENEALSLHALMMSGMPGYILMKEDSLSVIEKIRSYRQRTNHFLCFTLDAGPNVHIIYSKENKKEIEDFIHKELKPFCHLSQIIWDRMGEGPKRIEI
jgi:diphosphomevalonate decarboxylase